MKHKIFIPTLLALIFVLGCNRETPQEPITTPEEDVATVIQNLREFTQNPELGLAKISGGKRVVRVPAGSVDALAAAIAEVRDGGVVLLRAGQHTESRTVTVDHRVKILGEPGAILISDTKPGDIGATLDPALHVLGASQTVVWGLELRPKDAIGGTAILLENSPKAVVGRNTMRDWQYGVLIQECDRANITENTIVTASWENSGLAAVYGIVSINGERVEIEENDVSNAFFGIWLNHKDGEAEGNKLHGNYIGMIFCRVAEFDFTLPSGQPAPAKSSATNWSAEGNNSFGNADAGYLVIDGANNNVLKNNNGSNNGTYDIELTGETDRFGPVLPTSFNNKVVAGRFQSVVIKNCGENNTVVGGRLVDNTQDPCF